MCLPEIGGQSWQTSCPGSKQPAKETKTDLKGLLLSIRGEHGEYASSREEDTDAQLQHKFTIY